jgi:hypothetical protein
MTSNAVIWHVIMEHIPRKTWVPRAEVYAIVKNHTVFDGEDMEPGRAPSRLPLWQINVRRLLRTKQKDGRVLARRN